MQTLAENATAYSRSHLRAPAEIPTEDFLIIANSPRGFFIGVTR